MERIILVCFNDKIKRVMDDELARHKTGSGQWWTSDRVKSSKG